MCSDFAAGGVDKPSINNIRIESPEKVKKVQESSATLSSTDKEIYQEQQAKIETRKPAEVEVADRVQKIEEYIQSVQRDLAFSVDDDTGETVIRVYDTVTEELVRQIPSDIMLKLHKAYGENVGRLFDDKA